MSRPGTSTQQIAGNTPSSEDSSLKMTRDLLSQDGNNPSAEQLTAAKKSYSGEKVWDPRLQDDLQFATDLFELPPADADEQERHTPEKKVLPRVDGVTLDLHMKNLALGVIRSHPDDPEKQDRLIDLLEIKAEYKEKIRNEVQIARSYIYSVPTLT